MSKQSAYILVIENTGQGIVKTCQACRFNRHVTLAAFKLSNRPLDCSSGLNQALRCCHSIGASFPGGKSFPETNIEWENWKLSAVQFMTTYNGCECVPKSGELVCEAKTVRAWRRDKEHKKQNQNKKWPMKGWQGRRANASRLSKLWGKAKRIQAWWMGQP